jgi:hypothetical protein
MHMVSKSHKSLVFYETLSRDMRIKSHMEKELMKATIISLIFE